MKRLILISLATSLLATSPAWAELVKKTQLYVGRAAQNNGTVTNDESFLKGNTEKWGYSIDDASATPASDFVPIYAGDDVQNNKVVSGHSDHLGSTQPIGYLSKKPIPRGHLIRMGAGPCNNGEATDNTLHKGCSTEFLGYSLPND